MDKLGNIGFVAKNCGVEMKETVKKGVCGTTSFLFKSIGVMDRGLGGKTRGFGDKITAIADRVTDFSDKI